MKEPLARPPAVATAASSPKFPARACSAIMMPSSSGATISTMRRPMRSDIQPPIAEATPHEMEVRETRLATSGIDTSRSRAISSSSGARVVPLHDAEKEARHAAAINAHGIARSNFMSMAAFTRARP